MARLINYKSFLFLYAFASLCFNLNAQRLEVSLNNDWLTSLSTTNDWKKVNIPHNWDDYHGYRRLIHGNLHGDAIYKKSFIVKQPKQGKRFFLFFEGVGSYATVYVNKKLVGSHAGGRTTFTLDITDAVKTGGSQNDLLVKASHPADIQDLPWVCGGCSDERGFSEGSQPMGIFRPVHLITTNDVYIEPFGVHGWADIRNNKAALTIETTIRNRSLQQKEIVILHQLLDRSGKVIMAVAQQILLASGDSVYTARANMLINEPFLWSPADPYLYKIVSTIKQGSKVFDEAKTDFGFRTINWKTPTNQFLLNGKPVFINGIAEYEHLLGQSHAFSKEQIISRMKWIKAAGFNAFRDAHQPHNLLYGQLCDQTGSLWWTQFSAHIWYDSPAFRNNFKQLLKEWVIERRNDPSVILWGLQNESKLPEDFAKECTELIRSLDPTASSQRLITTCNGGSGTDWDVPQNWSGTYGGDPGTYASDIKKQVLIGEYGAWRTIDLHTEGGFVQNGILSEDRMTQLMEQKVRLAESVKDSCAGQFFWLLTSHDNPGRVQGGEGVRELDRVGPVNYKGLLTPWEEPTDAFYMFRSNYAPKDKEPMVYIVSHTWPGRWGTTGKKDSIIVYSNCDEVELFSGKGISLGRKKRNGIGTHFQWDGADIKKTMFTSYPVEYSIVYAIGYVSGKAVARDHITLDHMVPAGSLDSLLKEASPVTKPKHGYNYIYRINCGGPDYTDQNGNLWLSDRRKGNEKTWGSLSWTDDFPGMPAFFGSQRRIYNLINGTRDWELFHDFRYGKDKLRYEFPLQDGEYLVEFYFIEPWLGVGGGMKCSGMRLFDVAINGKTVLQNLDIWKEAGTNTALKKIVKTKITGGKMIISFPQSKSGQAIISAIAIATLNKNIKPAPSHSLIINPGNKLCKVSSWLDIGDKQYSDAAITFRSLPSSLFGADWLQFSKRASTGGNSFTVSEDADVFIGIDKSLLWPADFWLKEYENTKTEIETDEKGGTTYAVYRKRFSRGSVIASDIVNTYLVIALPVTTMQPAYDLKPLASYRANVAVVSEGVQKETFAERECAMVKSKSFVNIQWPVQTGVADIYSMTLKYFYPNEKNVTGRLQLIGAGNTMMLDEPVNFTFTRPGKWNQFTINTGNMINAGNYIVKLIIESAEGLAVSGIEIQ